MKMLNRTLTLFFVLAAGSVSSAWSQQEAVKGHFDSVNDWFVFEWVNPETGKEGTIFDSANKIKPVIHANISFDVSGTGTYTYQVSNLNGAVQLLDSIFVAHPAGRVLI